MGIVFITYCNHSIDKLNRFIDSLKNNTSQDFVIYLNDQSETNYGRYSHYKDKVFMFMTPYVADWGYSVALDMAYDAYSSDVLVFCNDDDVFMPTMVEDVLVAFNDPTIDVVYYDMLHRRLNGTQPFITEPIVCRIDKSAFAIRRDKFIDLNGFEDTTQFGDGRFVEKAVARGLKFKKINKVLLDKE
jgi:glycosyltransferase involved in cell wall biosynthesis